MDKKIENEFLLKNSLGQELYHKHCMNSPIVDYHCHINPEELLEDKVYQNITQIWLDHDHYKWRLMRADGIDERCITGDADDEEKFIKFAQMLERAPGNPVYHWCQMELKRYFGIDQHLCGSNAREIWKQCNQSIEENGLCPSKILHESNVRLLCTTDDPVDSLDVHDILAKDSDALTRVLPTWRPDKIVDIEKETFRSYIELLSEVSGIEIKSFQQLKTAILSRLDHFEQHGCVISDHGLKEVYFMKADGECVDRIIQKALCSEQLSEVEIKQYKTELMLFLAQEYSKRQWAMQLHFGVRRNINSRMFELLGPDSGFDCIVGNVDLAGLIDFLNDLEGSNSLPKMIVYSLNPNDCEPLGSIIGGFQSGRVKGKIQLGSAWWFNDHRDGIERHLKCLANFGLLGSFIGMTTDSRCLLSYVRHDYFRRIICNMIGEWVERNEFIDDHEILERLVTGISMRNCTEYFGFNLEG